MAKTLALLFLVVTMGCSSVGYRGFAVQKSEIYSNGQEGGGTIGYGILPCLPMRSNRGVCHEYKVGLYGGTYGEKRALDLAVLDSQTQAMSLVSDGCFVVEKAIQGWTRTHTTPPSSDPLNVYIYSCPSN